MSDTLTMCCPHCKGAGKINLPIHLRETLNYIEAGYSTSVEIHQEFLRSVCLSAVCNRLSDLHDLGLVKWHKSGKQWIYTL